jgi:hypothetical protein
MSFVVASSFVVPVVSAEEMFLVTLVTIAVVRLNFLLVAVLHNAEEAQQEALVALLVVLLEAQAVLVAKQPLLLVVSVVEELSAESAVQ